MQATNAQMTIVLLGQTNTQFPICDTPYQVPHAMMPNYQPMQANHILFEHILRRDLDQMMEEDSDSRESQTQPTVSYCPEFKGYAGV